MASGFNHTKKSTTAANVHDTVVAGVYADADVQRTEAIQNGRTDRVTQEQAGETQRNADTHTNETARHTATQNGKTAREQARGRGKLAAAVAGGALGLAGIIGGTVTANNLIDNQGDVAVSQAKVDEITAGKTTITAETGGFSIVCGDQVFTAGNGGRATETIAPDLNDPATLAALKDMGIDVTLADSRNTVVLPEGVCTPEAIGALMGGIDAPKA